MLTQRLRHRITIQKPGTPVQDGASGDVITPWVDLYADVAAEVLTGPGRELIASQAVQAETDARITLRWLPGVNQAMRVSWDGRFYNITGIDTDKTARHELRLRCQEGMTDGR